MWIPILFCKGIEGIAIMMKTIELNLRERESMIRYIEKEIEAKKPFADIIKGCVDIAPSYLSNLFETTLKLFGYTNEISRAWIHFMDKGSDHAAGHTHSHDTAVYYLRAEGDCGDLLFNDSKEILHPTTGMFVIVPALENHSMTENKSDIRRLALAFPIKRIES